MIFNSLDYAAFLALALLGFWSLRLFWEIRSPGDGRDLPSGQEGSGQPLGVERTDPDQGTRGRRGSGLRMGFLFVASCIFYMAWSPVYIGLILFSTLLDYMAGLRIESGEDGQEFIWFPSLSDKDPRLAGRYLLKGIELVVEKSLGRLLGVRRAWLTLSLTGNLGLLGLFKYFNFFSSATTDALGLVGVDADPLLLDVLLPVGISFYTFQTLSYTIDIYRGKLKPTQNLVNFAFYVTFFPQLVAGPIVRAAEFLPQLARRPVLDPQRVGKALFLISTGLLKKVIFADFISVNLVDRVFDDPAAFSGAEVLVGLYGFTLQIYADFSGYTDIARGSALLFGIQLPENFDRPYTAKSVAEFWRRWHMTLSTWLRDYLYFPLGGSQKGAARTYLNLWITIFLIGLWHGASWTFVIYGNLQAMAVMLNRAWSQERRRRGWKGKDPIWVNVLKVLATLQFVVFSRILFRATDLSNAHDLCARLISGTTSLAQVDGSIWRILALGFLLHYLPKSWLNRTQGFFVNRSAWVQGLMLAAVAALIALFDSQEVVPYIYFQF